MAAKFQLKTAKDGRLYFNLLAANGEVVLTSQMYASKASASKGVQAVKNNAEEEAQFSELENEGGKHYFVLKARNHQTIGTSQSYATKAAMKKGIRSVIKTATKAAVVDESEGG